MKTKEETDRTKDLLYPHTEIAIEAKLRKNEQS